MIIGLSGPSGSGKTTIARALRQAYSAVSSNSVQILHQDDFYKPEEDIPKIHTRAGEVVNWDCPEAIDMSAMVDSLRSYKVHGKFPDEVKEELKRRAKEDKNDTGSTGVTEALVQKLKDDGKIRDPGQDLLIVDGFMLYPSRELMSLFDLPILLRGSFKVLKYRRESRSGYVTLEGFWKDPDGYFEDCVWPEYVRAHNHLFAEGNVEGKAKEAVGVVIGEELDSDLDSSFSFVVESLLEVTTEATTNRR